MKKIKELLILNIIFMLVLILVVPVKANGLSFKSEVSTNKKTIQAGDTVDITVSIKDINMGDKGINVLEGTISYDKDIFEQVKSSDIKSANNWSTTFNDEGEALDGKFLAATLGNGIKEDIQMFTVTFKTKKDIDETTTTKIDFKDLTSNDGTNLVNSGTKSIDIKIEVEKTNTNPSEDKNNVNTNNTIGNTANGNNTSNIGSNNGNKTNGNSNSGINNNKNTTISKQNVDSTKSNSGLPKTGKTSFLVFATMLGVILLVVFGIKTRNMKDI